MNPSERQRIRRMMQAADHLSYLLGFRIRKARGKHRKRLDNHADRLFAFSRRCLAALHAEER